MTHEELCRHIVDKAQDAIIHAARNGIVRLWNAGAEALFGYPASEALGRSLDPIIPERLRQRHWEGFHRVVATGETKYGRELLSVPGLHKDGSRLSLEFSIVLLSDAAGEPGGVAAILRDVTQRRERERALQQRLATAAAQLPSAPHMGGK